MRFRVLGAIGVESPQGETASPRSDQQRRLLAALLIGADRAVEVDRLAEAVWGDDQPGDPGAAVQTLVSRLRRWLGPEGRGVLVTEPTGYRLAVAVSDLDTAELESLVAAATASLADDPVAAARAAERAMALWRGDPYPGADDVDGVTMERSRLAELRTAAAETLAEARLRSGQAGRAVADLERLVGLNPLGERGHALLMRALYATGRQADALRLYQELRARLADELGLEPSPELRDLEARILAQDLDDGSLPSAGTEGAGRPRASVSPATPVAARGRGVPVPVSSWVGRDADLAAVTGLLANASVITLIGPGGVGKTRLALHVAGEVAGRFPDGVWIVEMAPLQDETAVVPALASVLGIQPRAGVDLVDRVVELLSARRALLVLDNCEHLIDEAARVTELVVRHCPRTAVLATSREALGVDGEQWWPVAPLRLEAADGDPSPAVRLFLDRARAVRPDLAHGAADLEAVARICRRLDGLPLAIELAAARMANLSLAELDDALEHRFAVLSRGRRTSDARHRSLRAVIDWSYRQLDDDSRTVLDRLSAFAGKVDAQAIARVVPGEDLGAGALDDALAQLVERSLLGYDPADGRYVMLETIRAFGAERLQIQGDAAAVADRHATWVVDLLAEAHRRIETPAEGDAAATVVDHLAEIRRAHHWLRETGDEDRLVRFVAASWWFINRLTPDLAGFAEDAVGVVEASLHPDMAGALGAAATAAWMRGDLEVARQRCLKAIEAGGTSASTAAARSTLGDVLLFEGDLDASVGAYRAAADAAGEDLARASYDRGNAALPMAYGGHVAEAVAEAGRALRDADATGFPSGRAWARYILGEALLDTDPARSLDLHRQALELASQCRNDFLAGVAGLSVASLEGRKGQGDQAMQRYPGLIDTWVRGGSWIQLWTTMRNLVELLVRLGRYREALVLMGAMGASYRAAPPFGSDATRLVEADESARAALGLREAEAALVEGASLDDNAAVAFARAVLEELLRS